MIKNNTLKSLLILVLLGFIWGSGYSLAKFAMSNGVKPWGYAFWQSLGPALLLTGIGLLRREISLNFYRFWPYFLICGFLGIAVPNTNMYFIASHIPAGLMAVLVNTVPLMVYPLALMVRMEKYDPLRILAILLGMIGIILIISPGSAGIWSNWSLWTLISPLAFALCSIYIALKQPPRLNALASACGMLLMASLLLLPLVIQQQAFYPLTPPFSAVKGVVVLEIVLSSVGYILFFNLIRTAGPVFYSLTGNAVALTGLFWGYLIYDEVPGFSQSLAVICIILSIFLVSWRQARQQED